MLVSVKSKFKLVKNSREYSLKKIVVIVNRMVSRSINIVMEHGNSPLCVLVCLNSFFGKCMTFKDVYIRCVEYDKEYVAVSEPVRRTRLAR